MRVGSLYSGLLTKEDLQVHTQHIVSIPQCRHDDDAMFCWWIEHVVSGVCRWFVCLYTSIHSPPALIYPCFAAADARGVACAALQGTPFSSTHSSSTADLKRLQSLGGVAFSKILSLSYKRENNSQKFTNCILMYSWFQVSWSEKELRIAALFLFLK